MSKKKTVVINKQINKMDINEFVEKGFLQEVNRLFFHPLGMALEVTENKGEHNLSGIWDFRDDPEGVFYTEKTIKKSKINHVEKLRKSKVKTRKNTVGIKVNSEGIQLE